MRRLTILFLTIILFSCVRKSERKDQVIFDRIEYIYNLKKLIDENIWKDFFDKKFDLPLVYYTDSACYIANPTEKFVRLYNPNLIVENRELKIYKTHLLDSIPFHLATEILFGDSTADYNYKSPFMNCSSFEITRKTIPGINSTEQWTTMVIHEYFHGFQYKHQTYLDYFEKDVANIAEDSLRHIYKSNTWFKDSVDKENDILLSAINSNDQSEIFKLIDSFFQLRAQRRERTKQLLNFDIKTIEEAYETMEGTARYVEYNLYQRFATKEPDYKLAKSDTSYHSYEYFRNFKIENDQWLYLTSKTSYFYATGFNLARLLDKLKIEYKSRLFSESGLSLEQLLKMDLTKNGW